MASFFDKQHASRAGAAQNVAIGAASAASTVFGAQTYQIRVCATGNCHFRVGAGTPTAVATDTYLPANVIDYIAVTPGSKLAVIQDAASTGNINITEMS